MKILKRAAALCCLLALALCLAPRAAWASGRSIGDVQAEIEGKKQHITELAAAIEANKDNREAAEAALADYQLAYDELVALIAEQAALIDTTALELDEKGRQLSETIQSIQDNKALYTRRLRAIYEMNTTNAVLQSMLNTVDFSDIVQVSVGLQNISRRDTQMLRELADSQTLYEEQKAALEEMLAVLREEMLLLEENRAWNEQKMQEMREAIANANYQIQLREQETELAEAEVEQLVAELAAIFAALQESGSREGDGSVRYDGPLLWPVAGHGRISSYYGDYRSNTRTHYGIDIPAATGTPIRAAASGHVLTATWHPSYGNYLVLDHGQGLRTLYAHCSELWVQQGDTVAVGDDIAGVGNTGNSFGAHLHFEVHDRGGRQNPLDAGYLNP